MRPGRPKKSRKRAGKNRNITYKFLTRMKAKMLIVFLIIIGMLIALVGRLAYIELKSGDKYGKIVLNQQEYSSKTIPFRRGDIVDRKGTVLATSTDVYNVILDCSVLTSKEDYMEPTLSALAQCFELNTDDIRTYVKANPKKRYYVLAKKLHMKKLPNLSLCRMTRKQEKISKVSGLKRNISETIRMTPWLVPCLDLPHPVTKVSAGWKIIIMMN